MKLVKVSWTDTLADVGWSSDELEPLSIDSVGWLIKETDEKIVLSGMVGTSGLLDYNCRQAIPRGCIVKIEILEDDDATIGN